MKFLSAKNPVWGDAKKTSIVAEVTFDNGLTVPFTAMPNDSEQYGIDAFNAIIANQAFVPIAPYVAPVVPALTVNGSVKTAPAVNTAPAK